MKPLKTFNNVILGQFVLTGIPIKVYVDGVYYTITSPDDLEDSIYGFGMDEDGQMHEFDYRRIEHLLVNDNVITLDVYNDAMQKEFGGDSCLWAFTNIPPDFDEIVSAPVRSEINICVSL